MANATREPHLGPTRGRLIAFPEALKALGPNDQARGEALGLSRRCIQAYSQGEFPLGIERLMWRPGLLRALADDAERILQENRAAQDESEHTIDATYTVVESESSDPA